MIESGRSIDFKNEESKARIFASSEIGRENRKITFQEVKDGIWDMGWFRHRFFGRKKLSIELLLFLIRSKQKCKFGRMRRKLLHFWRNEKIDEFFRKILFKSLEFRLLSRVLIPFKVWFGKNEKIKSIKSMMGYPL